VANPGISPRQRPVILDLVNQDIRDVGNSLIEGVTKAWDQLLQQIDDFLGWSPGPVPSMRRPSAMADGELRAALHGVAASLIGATSPGSGRARAAPGAAAPGAAAPGAAAPATPAAPGAAGDARWRFNLPAVVETQVPAMFAEAFDAFRFAVAGLDVHASPAVLAAVGRLTDAVARTRWLLEPPEPAQRRERGYALAEEAIDRMRSISGHAEEADDTDHADLAGEIADRAATMDARLAELRQADGLRAVKVPRRRTLLRGYLPTGAEPFALLTATDSRPATTPSALFYSEPGTGDPLRDFERLQLTRAYWLAQAITLYADVCQAAAPVLGRGDWAESIAAAERRFRPLCDEAAHRYRQRLRRGLHPGL
jgi:hypothetical protein